jgi:hypothetical protein
MSICTVNISGTRTADCGSYPCSYGGGGHGTTAVCCIATYTDCAGTNSHSCGTYPSCSTPCCYPNTTGCGPLGGVVTYDCSGLSHDDCTSLPASACCWWDPIYSVCGKMHCHDSESHPVGNTNCAACGCTASGDCQRHACNTLTEGNCASCTGCSKNGTCAERSCAGVAALDNNPDVCAGCNTCGANWSLTDARGSIPWDIVVTDLLTGTSGGSVDVASSRLLDTGGIEMVSGVGVTLTKGLIYIR